MKRHPFLIFSLISAIIASCAPLPTHAQEASSARSLDQGFNPNHILSDDDIFKADDFSYARLVSFLKQKGTLADRTQTDIDGKTKPVADIVWRVAMSYKINPKYLLALMQKEQSLVEDPDPEQKQFDWATGYGVCDSCSMNDPAVLNFKGFAPQLEWAAKQHREKYLLQLLGRGFTIGGYAIGKTAQVDGRTVTPANQATAMLYTYTPHIHGNLNLWRIWKRWFSISFPDGTIVRASPSGKTYLLRYGEKRPFASKAVLASRIDEAKIINAQDDDLTSYVNGSPIRFAPYSLLRIPKGKIYLLTQDDEKRPIESKKTFQKLGFNEDEIEDVEFADLEGYATGTIITATSTYPQGVLVKTKEQSGVWYVEDGVRHPLVHSVFLKLYFSGYRIRQVTKKALESYTLGDPYLLHDGELVRSTSSSTVYVVEHSALRPIPSTDVFEAVGWKWKNVMTVPPNVISLHKLGEPFTLQPAKDTQVAQVTHP